jgi:hypothetical protein
MRQARRKERAAESVAQLRCDRRYRRCGCPEYLKKFEASLSAAIKGGFILAEDKQEILDLAAITYRNSY